MFSRSRAPLPAQALILARILARLPGWVGLLLGWLLWLGGGVGPLAWAEAEAAPAHLTGAEVRTVPTTGFSPPPYRLAGDGHGAMEGMEGEAGEAGEAGATPWTPTELPRAPLPHHALGGLPDPGQAPTQITWYRLTLPPLPPGPEPYHLYIPRWKTDGTIAVYGDGRLLYQSHANLQWNGSNRPLWIALNDQADRPAPRALVIRLQHLRGIGGALSSLWVGTWGQIGWRYLLRDWLQATLPFFSSAAFLSLGLFSLGVWLPSRRKGGEDRLYLLFFLVSAAAYLRTLHAYLGLERLPLSDEWFGWITVNSTFWLFTCTHLFLEALHRHPLPRLTRLALGVSGAVSLATLPLPGLPDATLVAPFVYGALLLLGATLFGINLWHAWQSKVRYGVWLAGWSLLSLHFGIADWMLQNNLISIEGMFLGPYANVGAFFLFTYALYRTYLDARTRLERANEHLEARLAEREAELLENHRRLREIEQRELLHQERERMMQDIHDGLGSSLLSALRVVEQGRADETQIAQVLRSCIDDMKLTIDSMEPVEADLLLLLATLRFRLAPRLQASGIHLRWQVQDLPPLPWLDQRGALHILRILQEAFTNIIKHTDAREIQVTTTCQDDRVAVSITDNGQGFDLAQAAQGPGRGLNNQRRRARELGGEITWTRPPKGCCLTLWLPRTR